MPIPARKVPKRATMNQLARINRIADPGREVGLHPAQRDDGYDCLGVVPAPCHRLRTLHRTRGAPGRLGGRSGPRHSDRSFATRNHHRTTTRQRTPRSRQNALRMDQVRIPVALPPHDPTSGGHCRQLLRRRRHRTSSRWGGRTGGGSCCAPIWADSRISRPADGGDERLPRNSDRSVGRRARRRVCRSPLESLGRMPS